MLPKDYYAISEQQAEENKTTLNVVANEATSYRTSRRTLAIRHVSEHNLISIIEIVSPANKNRAQSVRRFVDKACSALANGIHTVVLDLHAPGTHDPTGMHGAIWEELIGGYEPPIGKTLTAASYVSQYVPEAYVEPLALGDVLPTMPLFLAEDWYVDLPLEQTYTSAFAGIPAVWKDVLESEI